MAEKGQFVRETKRQLLSLQIKSECCKSSFILGTELFAGKRKNAFSDAVAEYIESLKSKKKKRTFFDENTVKGYVTEEKDGEKYPLASGMVCQACLSHLIRGAFLVSGRVSKTAENLHLEMVMPNRTCLNAIAELLTNINLTPKSTLRRNELLLYYKKADSVEDFLSFIGAQAASFEIMNDVIMKGLRSTANRQKNYDTNNLKRAVEVASVQLLAINSIIENEGSLDGLPVTLRETAKIRLENPIDSLDEIIDVHLDKISKSGVTHRLHKIIAYAKNKGYIDITKK